VSEIKFLTLPTTLGDVTVELHWDPKARSFDKEAGRLWHRLDEGDVAEMARKGGLSEAVIRERLEAELDLDARLG